MRLTIKETDFPPHVQVKKSKRARRIALRLNSKKRVFNLIVPPGGSLKKALRFAEEHEDWMRAKLSALPPSIPFTDGAVIPLFGQGTLINVSGDIALKRTQITWVNDEILVKTNKEDPGARIERYLKAQAKERLTELTLVKAGKIGKKVQGVSVRDTISRWGSCSHDGKISFSWRLLFAPPTAMDYVIAHEVAHLKHLDHSKAFWALCRDLSDDFLEGRYWMDNHGAELMRYG